MNPDWKPALPEEAEKISALRGDTRIEGEHNTTRVEDEPIDNVGVHSWDGEVYWVAEFEFDDHSFIAMDLTPEQARAWAKHLEKAADYAEQGQDADLV